MGDFKAVGGTTARIIRDGAKSSIRKLFVQNHLQLFVTRLRPQRGASFGSQAAPLLILSCSLTHYKPGRRIKSRVFFVTKVFPLTECNNNSADSAGTVKYKLTSDSIKAQLFTKDCRFIFNRTGRVSRIVITLSE